MAPNLKSMFTDDVTSTVLYCTVLDVTASLFPVSLCLAKPCGVVNRTFLFVVLASYGLFRPHEFWGARGRKFVSCLPKINEQIQLYSCKLCS